VIYKDSNQGRIMVMQSNYMMTQTIGAP